MRSRKGQPVDQFLAQHGHNGTLLLNRFLDTVGNGTGTKNANGDYSLVEGIFRIDPPAGQVYHIRRMLVEVHDSAIANADDYGNIAGGLTNGVNLEIRDGSGTLHDFMDGIPVVRNSDWGHFCYDGTRRPSTGGGAETLNIRWSFDKAGQEVRLDGNLGEFLCVDLNDDLQGLIEHRFMVQGWVEIL